MKASEWAPQFIHEDIRMNLLYIHWCKSGTADARDALRSAKLAWIGPICVARPIRAKLLRGVLDKVVSAAAFQPKLDSSGIQNTIKGRKHDHIQCISLAVAMQCINHKA